MRKEPAFPVSQYLTTECRGLSTEDWFLGQCLAGGRNLPSAQAIVKEIMETRAAESEYDKVKKEALAGLRRAWHNLSRSRALSPASESERGVVAAMEDAMEALK